MGCVHAVRIRFLASIMQWVSHIIENLKCTIKRTCVCVCSGHRRKWLIFFFHLSKLVISFEKRKNQFSILRFFDFALRCCWCYESFLHTSNIFYITFFFCCSLSVSLSSFHNFLWPANASPHTLTFIAGVFFLDFVCSMLSLVLLLILALLIWYRVCLLGFFSSIFLPFISFHFVFIHQLLFCFILLSSFNASFFVRCYYSTEHCWGFGGSLFSSYKYEVHCRLAAAAAAVTPDSMHDSLWNIVYMCACVWVGIN